MQRKDLNQHHTVFADVFHVGGIDAEGVILRLVSGLESYLNKHTDTTWDVKIDSVHRRMIIDFPRNHIPDKCCTFLDSIGLAARVIDSGIFLEVIDPSLLPTEVLIVAGFSRVKTHAEKVTVKENILYASDVCITELRKHIRAQDPEFMDGSKLTLKLG